LRLVAGSSEFSRANGLEINAVLDFPANGFDLRLRLFFGAGGYTWRGCHHNIPGPKPDSFHGHQSATPTMSI
jgi:hypothetical protein